MTPMNQALAGFAALAGLLASGWALADGPRAGGERSVIAVVEGTSISDAELEEALAATIRQKFYHRQPSEDQLEALRRDVTELLVNRVLLVKEAQRRSIRADEEKVRAELAAFERRYRQQPNWPKIREQALPALTRALQEQSIVAQMEAATRAVPPPGEAELRSYYTSRPELFTEPERVRLSMILLKVDPSSPAAAWEQALQLAQDIAGQIAAGADFAELARRHSGDASASRGGDMGYQHRGMLPPGIEKEIDKIAPGGILGPIRLLEGMAVLRLAERKPAQLRTLEDVRRTVAELWTREQGETQWRGLIARLRADADIRMVGDPPTATGSTRDPETH